MLRKEGRNIHVDSCHGSLNSALYLFSLISPATLSISKLWEHVGQKALVLNTHPRVERRKGKEIERPENPAEDAHPGSSPSPSSSQLLVFRELLLSGAQQV